MKEKYIKRTSTIEDALSEAFSVFADLATEMRDAFDNTPESLQGSSVGQAREQAADDLEGLEEPTVPDVLKNGNVDYHVPNRTPKQFSRLSRRERRDDAVMILDAAVEYLREIADDELKAEELRETASDLAETIEEAKDNADNVEFPGMRG